jgi:hypothetical protein
VNRAQELWLTLLLHIFPPLVWILPSPIVLYAESQILLLLRSLLLLWPFSILLRGRRVHRALGRRSSRGQGEDEGEAGGKGKSPRRKTHSGGRRLLNASPKAHWTDVGRVQGDPKDHEPFVFLNMLQVLWSTEKYISARKTDNFLILMLYDVFCSTFRFLYIYINKLQNLSFNLSIKKFCSLKDSEDITKTNGSMTFWSPRII